MEHYIETTFNMEILLDDVTHFCELIPCAVPTVGVTAEAILDWHSRYGAPYSPWMNGSIERMNRDIVQVLRAMCLEAKVGIRDWVHFIPVLQSNLNHTPVPSLVNKAPVELFCVLPASSPLDFGFNSKDNTFIELGTSTREIESKLEQLRARKARKEQTRRNQESQRGVKVANFDVGDYVLRSRVDQTHKDKSWVTWFGPYHVIGTNEHFFRAQHQVTGAKSDVHASRLKFYADASFAVTEDIREHMAAQEIPKEHRLNSAKKGYEIPVGWKGPEPIKDPWVSQFTVQDILMMVNQYIAASSDVQLPVTLEQL
ncbi:hypothetical protein PHPALM_28273 [Phytophthora palmivora]|uniref:Integrase catalytic domain-containing protein n=1 Tax=Phytophthora palmivora TaxID=4796 RepID=A0A2P4XAI0_9STRA|nr:hypothetical protein PHPALM_28273 [Phytophthora palmivora]